MSEVKQFRLPDVGEGLTEADIVAWHVKPGDRIALNQVIVEIETAKAVVELPSPYEGVVTSLLADEGATVDVGTPIIAVDVAGQDGVDVPGQGDEGVAGQGDEGVAGQGDEGGTGGSGSQQATTGTPAAPGAQSPLQMAFEPGIHGSPAPTVERQAVLVGYGVKLGTTKRRQRKAVTAPPVSSPSQPPASIPSLPPASGGEPDASAGNGQMTGRVAAKPPVRKLARDLGVDLAALVGTGPGGTITREDVEGASQPPAGPAAPAPGGRAVAGGAREERILVKGVRKHTAAAVTASAFSAPHVTEFLQVDVTATMEALGRLRHLPEFAGLRPSPLLLVAKALLLAVARHPMINSSWDGEAQEIIVKHYVNLGIAAATGRGLLVPNIKDAHTMSLPGLAAALAALTATAREGKTQPAGLTGGTITITNVGVFGIDAGTPILTPGEAAILALGQIRQGPWVHGGELAIRQVATLSLSFDHRIVDGDLASAVLRDIGAMLTDPLTMLAWG